MSLIGLCSVHGAPGVTTATLALAAAWPRPEVVVVEADPFGGVLAPRFGLADTPGLVSLAAAARPELTVDALAGSVQRLPGGLAVVVGWGAPEQGWRVFSDLAPPLARLATGTDTGLDVLVDGGRLDSGGTVSDLLGVCDLVVVVVRPVVEQLRLTAARLRRFTGRVPAAVLLVGDGPYRSGEIAGTLEADVIGALGWDPVSAAAVNGTSAGWGGGRRLDRSLLARSAATLADTIRSRLDVTQGAVTGGVS